jgi:hypothetical protein
MREGQGLQDPGTSPLLLRCYCGRTDPASEEAEGAIPERLRNTPVATDVAPTLRVGETLVIG